MSQVPITVQGAEKLTAELEELKSSSRPEVISAIAEARAHGDLKENAEYHAAREQQGLVEARIAHLENNLASAKIIDVTKITNNGKVIFGATVELLNLDTDNTLSYQLVGEDEADIKHNQISINSPIARALISKEAGDVVEVRAPGGEVEYEIISVQYI